MVSVELLKLLGIFDEAALEQVAEYGPRSIYNVRKFEVGKIKPCFSLDL